MSEVLLELAFYGKLVEGVDQQKAKQNMAQLFKASPEQIDKMFSGQRVVIRNKLDKDTAGKYVAVLRKNGVIVAAEVMSANAPAASVSATAPEPPTAPASSPVAAATPATPSPAPAQAAVAPSSAADSGRLQVAGERTDAVLAGTHMSLDPVGIRLSEETSTEAPTFDHLGDWSLAPVGSRMSDEKDLPPPIVPDTSELSVAPTGSNLSGK